MDTDWFDVRIYCQIDVYCIERSVQLIAAFGNTRRTYLYLCLRQHSLEACWAGITKGEPWSCFVSSYHTAVFIGFADQAKPVRFESATASTLHTLLIGFNPGCGTGTQGVGVWSAEVCWLHRHLLNHSVGQKVLNLLPSPGVPTHGQDVIHHGLKVRIGRADKTPISQNNCLRHDKLPHAFQGDAIRCAGSAITNTRRGESCNEYHMKGLV